MGLVPCTYQLVWLECCCFVELDAGAEVWSAGVLEELEVEWFAVSLIQLFELAAHWPLVSMCCWFRAGAVWSVL